MNKVVLASLALILVRDCDIGGPRFHGQIKGTWGGVNAGLMASDTTARVHIGCTAGGPDQARPARAPPRAWRAGPAPPSRATPCRPSLSPCRRRAAVVRPPC